MENKYILQVKNLSHRFPESNGNKAVSVLHDISLNIEKGEFVSLVGPSGGGKSTFLNILAGFVAPNKGEIINNSCRMKMIFQNFAIFPWLNIYQNIEFGLKMRDIDKKKRDIVVHEKLKEVGLHGFEKSYPKELSGGMRQRVGIARALAVDPDLLLMDEPFSNLDAFTAEILRQDLLKIWQKYNMTIIMVTHIIEEAVELSDKIFVLSKQPAHIIKNISVNMERPRDKHSKEFYEMSDSISTLIEK